MDVTFAAEQTDEDGAGEVGTSPQADRSSRAHRVTRTVGVAPEASPGEED